MLAVLPCLLLAMAGHAVAGPIPAAAAAEEVIVYGDDFARWDDTRWLLQTELVLPFGLTLGQDRDVAFDTYALQIRAVVACDKEHRLSKRKWEIGCKIEDVGILATTMRRWRRERDREAVQSVLDQIDAKLTGMAVQLQTDFRGGVNNVDLEGGTPRNERERVVQENLRQILGRMVAGFHLRIPDHAQRAGEWLEYNSTLMQMPSLTASRGNTMVKHVVSPRTGMQIVQSIGEGVVSVNIPVRQIDVPESSGIPGGGSAGGGGGGGGLGAAQAGQAETLTRPAGYAGTSQGESEIEATFQTRMNGVAIFDRDTGIMTERVWVVTGVPTASTGQGTQLPSFRNAGRITMLGPGDRPDVGPSTQVAWPGRRMGDLAAWVSIEVLPE